MPCLKTEFLLVLDMIRLAHWVTTIAPKYIAWKTSWSLILSLNVCEVVNFHYKFQTMRAYHSI